MELKRNMLIEFLLIYCINDYQLKLNRFEMRDCIFTS